jgi:hypothetical protein
MSKHFHEYICKKVDNLELFDESGSNIFSVSYDCVCKECGKKKVVDSQTIDEDTTHKYKIVDGQKKKSNRRKK